MAYKKSAFEKIYAELMQSLRTLEINASQFAGGRPLYRRPEANPPNTSLKAQYNFISEITKAKVEDDPHLKTLVCANLHDTLNKSRQILDELSSIKMMCQYIENDLNQNTSATLRSYCVGRITVRGGRPQSVAPLFMSLAARLDQDYRYAETSIQSIIHSVQLKFKELDCTL